MQRDLKAALLGLSAVGLLVVGACNWDKDKLFERNSPVVAEAIDDLDAGRLDAASDRLREYLKAGGCKDGKIPINNAADASSAAFDLSLTLFAIGERFGERFGEPTKIGKDGLTPEQQKKFAQRVEQADCAKMVLDMVLEQELPSDLRARAYYLRGNLNFLKGAFKEAIGDYESALRIIPGVKDKTADGVGRDAAWNRAIAMLMEEAERKQNEPDAGEDADADADADADGSDGDADGDGGDGDDDADGEGDDADADANSDGSDDGDGGGDSGDDDGGGPDSGDDGGEGDGGDADGGPDRQDAGGDAPKEAGGDGGGDQQDPKKKESEGGDDKRKREAEKRAGAQDDRMLDELGDAPIFQLAPKGKKSGRRPPMEDK